MSLFGKYRAFIGDSGNRALGFIDFSYMPYALGDALTWLMNLQVVACSNGLDRVEQLIFINPYRPSSKLQPHIDINNYQIFLDNLYPALLCSPMMDSIHVITQSNTFNGMLASKKLGGAASWPSFWSQARRKIDYFSHKRINSFHSEHGYLPSLAAPRGYEHVADDYLERELSGRFVVTVNIRQRRTHLNQSALHRDSPIDEWRNFFMRIHKRYPEVVFVLLGGYMEWERDMFSIPNAIIPRVHGFGMGMELALLFKSRLFMGSSSGFSAAATFSKVPYVITNYEHSAAAFTYIKVGDKAYPFALDNQVLDWQAETCDRLEELFVSQYEALRAGA